MNLWQRYRLRARRRLLRFRAFRSRRQITPVTDRLQGIGKDSILLVSVLRNEMTLLPYFMRYYRDLGIDHFLMIDNQSDDGSLAWLSVQPDVTLWSAKGSYKAARYGLDWTNWILMRHARRHWALVVDIDEFFVYPFCDSRPIRALTDWLDSNDKSSYPAMVLDMYPRDGMTGETYLPGGNPFEIADHFDGGNYTISRNTWYGNLWIQGGPRARAMFADDPVNAPSLNKIPLVKWAWNYAYASSTHMLLPRGLNGTYDEWGGERSSGCLLHAKFLSTLPKKVSDEMERREHFADSREYSAYAEALRSEITLTNRWSEKYVNWRQLEILGLMSKGSWA
ncbi:MAG: glycosyltransferase family 2 protein [Proteobacteria bacterium]|nr:glycosyltransferase family 2 protein [Pseudomonadota bacterium]